MTLTKFSPRVYVYFHLMELSISFKSGKNYKLQNIFHKFHKIFSKMLIKFIVDNFDNETVINHFYITLSYRLQREVII